MGHQSRIQPRTIHDILGQIYSQRREQRAFQKATYQAVQAMNTTAAVAAAATNTHVLGFRHFDSDCDDVSITPFAHEPSSIIRPATLQSSSDPSQSHQKRCEPLCRSTTLAVYQSPTYSNSPDGVPNGTTLISLALSTLHLLELWNMTTESPGLKYDVS